MEDPNSYMNGPDEQGRFGDYGGRYVAETLMPLILELEVQLIANLIAYVTPDANTAWISKAF